MIGTGIEHDLDVVNCVVAVVCIKRVHYGDQLVSIEVFKILHQMLLVDKDYNYLLIIVRSLVHLH